MDCFEGRGSEWNHSGVMDRKEDVFDGETMICCCNNEF